MAEGTIVKDDRSNEIAAKKQRTTTRKIGKCTFIVSSRFKDGKQRDIVATIARLIENDANIKLKK